MRMLSCTWMLVANGKVTSVEWKPEEFVVDNAASERERLLGLNLMAAMVDFGDVVTDGSFRLQRSETAVTLTPLPGSDGFTVEITLPARVVVADVDVVDPEQNMETPMWRRDRRPDADHRENAA